MKRICRYFSLLLASATLVPLASAQSTFDFNIGFGAFQDSAASQGLDINQVSGVFFACSYSTDPTCTKTKSLNAFALGFGGNLMLWKHLGVGASVEVQPGKQDYAVFATQVVATQTPGFSVQSRATFYDFDAIYQPVKTKKAALQFIGGIGGANVKFYEAEQSTDALAGAQNISQYYGSGNHFQVRGGVGVQIYLTDHFFVKPEFDVHYVPNLNQNFGRNVVTQEMVWVGYSFGGQ